MWVNYAPFSAYDNAFFLSLMLSKILILILVLKIFKTFWAVAFFGCIEWLWNISTLEIIYYIILSSRTYFKRKLLKILFFCSSTVACSLSSLLTFAYALTCPKSVHPTVHCIIGTNKKYLIESFSLRFSQRSDLLKRSTGE